jgi:hypothetical protein
MEFTTGFRGVERVGVDIGDEKPFFKKESFTKEKEYENNKSHSSATDNRNNLNGGILCLQTFMGKY